MRWLSLPVLALAGAGCSVGLSGEVGGEVLDFAEAVYAERTDVDPGTSIDFHDFRLWLMPWTDACERMPQLLEDLSDLRAELGFGMDSTAYCTVWEAIWADAVGGRPFWIGEVRLGALPRAEGEEVVTEYGWVDDAQTLTPDGPHLDGDLARYGAPDFAACAQEFEGDSPWSPTLHRFIGGAAQVTAWSRDDRLRVRLSPEVEGADGATAGTADASYCPAAWEWPLGFGLGL